MEKKKKKRRNKEKKERIKVHGHIQSARCTHAYLAT